MQLDQALRLAIQHQNAGRLDEAAAIHDSILSAVPDHPVATTLRARIDLKRNLPPEQLRAWLPALSRAMAMAPDYAPVHATLAEIADVAGDSAGARVFYHRALALTPAHGATVLLLGNQAQLSGDLSDAERLYRQCLCLMPSDRVAWTNLAATYLKQHRPADALEALDQVISRAPGDVRAHAYRTSALQALGRQDEVERIVGHGTLVRRQALSPPPAWSGLAAFNADLIAEMRDHPYFSGEVDPMRRAIRGGAVVRFLTTSRTPAVVALESMLVNAIDAYVAGLSADAAHPHLRSIPKGYTLDVWGNFLGDDGHQAGHIHNVGWLSGVYYAAVPDSVHSDDTERQGWLEFDRPGYGIPYDGDEPLKAVCPEAGLLMLFPSYVWHRTIPFRGGGERISIAFDLHPAT